MKQTLKARKKRIESIKHWLEKADSSYDEKEKLQGHMQVLLAKAELEQLMEKEHLGRKRHPWWMIPFSTIAIVLVGATLYWQHSIQSLDAIRDTVSKQTIAEQGGLEKRSEISPVQVHTMKRMAEEKTAIGSDSVEQKTISKTRESEKIAPPVRKNSLTKGAAQTGGQHITPMTSHTTPIMNEQQIRDTVYEAGNSLRDHAAKFKEDIYEKKL